MSEALSSALTPQYLSHLAGRLYPEGSAVFRTLQRYRPYICPFEELIPEVPIGASVLDVGCGAGLFLGLLDAVGREPDGTGFDASPQGIKLAKAMSMQGAGRLAFQRLDAELHPLKLEKKSRIFLPLFIKSANGPVFLLTGPVAHPLLNY